MEQVRIPEELCGIEYLKEMRIAREDLKQLQAETAVNHVKELRSHVATGQAPVNLKTARATAELDDMPAAILPPSPGHGGASDRTFKGDL